MSEFGDISLRGEIDETTIMVVWPTIGATATGRLVGRLAAIPLGVGVFTVGNLMALVTIPLSLGVFCWQLLPYVARRYRLTNQRVLIQKGLSGVPGESVGLDEFDQIEVEQLPGQAWLRAGDLRYLSGGREVLRLAGLSRPEVFRRACLETQMSRASVRNVLEHQPAV